jgi:5-aminolevulinate synthase
MNYDAQLDAALGRLHEEGRYRTFIDIERRNGQFPKAVWRRPDGHRTRHHRLVRQ